METLLLTHPHHLQKEKLKPTVIALGFFDGVHYGHQEVISKTIEIAKKKGMQSAVMTFNPHPKEVLRKTVEKVSYITPLEKKISFIEKLGVDILYVVNFSTDFANLTPQQFVDQYLIGLHVKHAVAGFDYTYGKLGKGTMETLAFHSRQALTYTTVSKIECGAQKISSTRIRTLLNEGHVRIIPELMGRFYEIDGIVVDGEKRGREIGFPTANIEPINQFIIPAAGVYAVRVKIENRWYDGVCNIGYKPTFHDNQSKQSIEVHLFDFSSNIYGVNVCVQWIEHIRKEKKFASINDLIEQIMLDSKKAKRILEKFHLLSCNS